MKADILAWLAGRPDAVVSAADVSNALGAYSSSTGYALRVLAASGAIDRVQEAPPRYRHRASVDAPADVPA